eukprot:GHVS01056548.1.p1 GENE.GHVS01056548.1~~GHVS01056548.1.p1  ORF type:complete len:615 (-),score=130.43 GHVS01056548.1:385-2229(-)
MTSVAYQSPSPINRLSSSGEGGGALRFFTLGGVFAARRAARGAGGVVATGKKGNVGTPKVVTVAMEQKTAKPRKSGSSGGGSRRELEEVGAGAAGYTTFVTAASLPLLEKKLVYHKKEGVHQAHMTEGDKLTDEGVATSTRQRQRLEVENVFPLLGRGGDSSASKGITADLFSPASSSSSPSFNANEMMELSGIQISGVAHNQHEDRFEATRSVLLRGEESSAVAAVDSSPGFLRSSSSAVVRSGGGIPAVVHSSSLPLEGPMASPLPTAVLPPSTLHHLPLTPRPFMSPMSSKGAESSFYLSPASAGGKSVRGAVIARKQRRRRNRQARKKKNEVVRQENRREREEMRDEIRTKRETRRQYLRHHLHGTEPRIGVDELPDKFKPRSPQGIFDWASWFDEGGESPATDVVSVDGGSEDVISSSEDEVTSPYWPMAKEMYTTDFIQGDISDSLWDQCLTDPNEMQGSWQVQLGQSDSISPILAELGFGMMKRSVVAAYPSIVKMSVLSSDPVHQPTVHMVTHLPMGITKQATIEFNGEEVNQPDGDTGAWQTVPYFVRGRAMQRRVNPKGVMFDVRCAFPADPAGVIPGKVMLFQWTFIPKGKAALVARRWLSMK